MFDDGREAHNDGVRPIAVALLAAAAAAALSSLAPAPWPEETAVLTVDQLDTRIGEIPVGQGSTAAETMVGPSGAVVVASDGYRSAGVVRVTIATGDGSRLELSDIRLRLELADGRTEPLPVIRWDEEEQVLVAERRAPVDSRVVLGLLGAVVVLWISEVIPLWTTSLLIPVALTVAGTSTATDALAPFFHPIIALFFGGFLMAEAMRRADLDHLAAVHLIARAGRGPKALFAAMIGVAAFASMWMSNTAAMAVLLPIALAVTTPLDEPRYTKALILTMAYAATIGGVGSAIGTPANPLAIEFLDEYAGREISFSGWFAYGLPMVVVFLPIMGMVMWFRYRVTIPSETFRAAVTAAREEADAAGRPDRDQIVVLAVFLGVLAVWLTQSWHGLSTGIVAVGGAAVLSILGRILPEDLGRISWESLLTFGGGLSLGFAMSETGTADWVATRLTGLAGVPETIGVLAVATLALGLTTVASNTATAAMMIPLAIPLAGILGIDPVVLVVVVAIASSVDFALVIGTPPTMMAYSTRLYTPGEVFRAGIALDGIGIAVLVLIVTTVWGFLGLV